MIGSHCRQVAKGPDPNGEAQISPQNKSNYIVLQLATALGINYQEVITGQDKWNTEVKMPKY